MPEKIILLYKNFFEVIQIENKKDSQDVLSTIISILNNLIEIEQSSLEQLSASFVEHHEFYVMLIESVRRSTKDAFSLNAAELLSLVLQNENCANKFIEEELLKEFVGLIDVS